MLYYLNVVENFSNNHLYKYLFPDSILGDIMNQNVGMADRIIRIVLAVVFIILALLYSPWWYIPAAIALVTGIVGWCGLYTLFKWNTCPVAQPVKVAKKSVKTSKKKKK